MGLGQKGSLERPAGSNIGVRGRGPAKLKSKALVGHGLSVQSKEPRRARRDWGLAVRPAHEGTGKRNWALCVCMRMYTYVHVYSQPGLCKKSAAGGGSQESAQNRIFHWELGA